MLSLNAMPPESMRWLAVLLDATAKGLVLLAAAGAVGLLLRRGSTAVRHLIWALAAASLVCLPLLSVALPQLQVPILPQWAATAPPRSEPPAAEAPEPPEAARYAPDSQFEGPPPAGELPAEWPAPIEPATEPSGGEAPVAVAEAPPGTRHC
ncbi:MAG: hypothetical protein QF792_06035 [Phycisphaerae bacterium]|jgi:hypothetical protein|nr:hypothetical protein [Phycisphaerae bacterium]